MAAFFGLLIVLLLAGMRLAYADCLQWVCSKDRTQCMCVVSEPDHERKIIPDRFNPWPPELDDRYGTPRRRD